MCGVCVLGVGGGDGVGYLWLEGGEGLLVTEVSMTVFFSWLSVALRPQKPQAY